MATPHASPTESPSYRAYLEGYEPGLQPRQERAVSWPAIFAGAAGAAALSLILLILGTGLGLASVSPWVQQGISATTFGLSTILWISLTQLAASGLGGYLAGRLRNRWTGTQPDEVYFRDTAHGFLSWAVATLATAALLTSTIGSILGTGVSAGASVAAGTSTDQPVRAAAGPGAPDDLTYHADSLFRLTTPPAQTDATSMMIATAPRAAWTAEAKGILANAARDGALPPADAAYLGQVVAQRTGMTQQDAQARVTETFARLQARADEREAAARDAADKARKASAYGALWLFISLLAGAFFASLAATFGGRQRDLA